MLSLETLLEGVVIPIDKPCRWTSFQAVNKIKSAIRNQYGIKKFKIGHAGTLDPLATGLLLVCVGKATKRIPQLQDGEKVYTGTMVLGATTPCYDLERPIDHRYPYAHITPTLLEEARKLFVGDIEQVPPIFSAVKIGGQRSYTLAQEGLEASPTPKTVHIDEFQITAFRPGQAANTNAENEHESNESNEYSYDSCDLCSEMTDEHKKTNTNLTNLTNNKDSYDSCDSCSEMTDEHKKTNTNLTNLTNNKDSYDSCDSCSIKMGDSCSEKAIRVPGKKPFALYKNPLGSVPPELPQVDFRIRCGKGTYIRSIARDFGLALDSGAFLASLRREQIGDYTLADAIPLEELKIE